MARPRQLSKKISNNFVPHVGGDAKTDKLDEFNAAIEEVKRLAAILPPTDPAGGEAINAVMEKAKDYTKAVANERGVNYDKLNVNIVVDALYVEIRKKNYDEAKKVMIDKVELIIDEAKETEAKKIALMVLAIKSLSGGTSVATPPTIAAAPPAADEIYKKIALMVLAIKSLSGGTPSPAIASTASTTAAIAPPPEDEIYKKIALMVLAIKSLSGPTPPTLASTTTVAAADATAKEADATAKETDATAKEAVAKRLEAAAEAAKKSGTPDAAKEAEAQAAAARKAADEARKAADEAKRAAITGPTGFEKSDYYDITANEVKALNGLGDSLLKDCGSVFPNVNCTTEMSPALLIQAFRDKARKDGLVE